MSERLCRLNEIGENEAKSFPLGETRFFVLRHGGKLQAYVNSCPHTGAPLDWVGDRFLDYARQHILCAVHGALFRIEDGHCIAGPCKGKSLQPVRIAVEGEWVIRG